MQHTPDPPNVKRFAFLKIEYSFVFYWLVLD